LPSMAITGTSALPPIYRTGASRWNSRK